MPTATARMRQIEALLARGAPTVRVPPIWPRLHTLRIRVAGYSRTAPHPVHSSSETQPVALSEAQDGASGRGRGPAERRSLASCAHRAGEGPARLPAQRPRSASVNCASRSPAADADPTPAPAAVVTRRRRRRRRPSRPDRRRVARPRGGCTSPRPIAPSPALPRLGEAFDHRENRPCAALCELVDMAGIREAKKKIQAASRAIDGRGGHARVLLKRLRAGAVPPLLGPPWRDVPRLRRKEPVRFQQCNAGPSTG